MSKTDVWMPLYIGDYLKDTTHLSTVEHGAYFLLLMAYWNNGGPLPDNDRRLAAITKLPAADWSDVRTVLLGFFTVEAGVWTHKRIDAELETARNRKIQAQQNGRRGAEKRYGKGSGGYSGRHRVAIPDAIPEAIADEQRNDSSSPSPSPVSTKVDTKTDIETGAHAVEPSLPPSFPKTEEDAVSRCMSAGIPDDFIKDVYHKALSRGGKDAREIPIAVWPSYVKTEWKYEQNRKEKEKHETRQPSGRPNFDRNAGTANAGKASQYAGLGKLATS